MCPRISTSTWQSQHLGPDLTSKLGYFLSICFLSSHMEVILNFTILFSPSHQFPPKEQTWLVCSVEKYEQTTTTKNKGQKFYIEKINIWKPYICLFMHVFLEKSYYRGCLWGVELRDWGYEIGGTLTFIVDPFYCLNSWSCASIFSFY